ncbi:MAG: formate/nitrite transporter family protein [Flavobacteriales bacterium]
MPALFGSDAFTPDAIAERIQQVGVSKARLPLHKLVLLGILAGGFIGLGAMFFVVVASDSTLGFAVSRVLGGVCFALGLLLVVVAGAELFTGNNLLMMAWADGRISTREVLRNWAIISLANLVGALGLAALVYLSGHTAMNQGGIGEHYVRIAAAKCALPFGTAFVSGVLCNVLVCLAVWMSFAGRTVVDKAIAIVPPIAAFVAAGFEHSVANMYFLPMGLLLKATHPEIAGSDGITMAAALGNLAPVMLGNLVGGSGFVALVYYLAYRRTMRGDP